tara:strand:+ start:272 stop:508 length:237 start_codon:yes stop_codon:yes gene_type:complete
MKWEDIIKIEYRTDSDGRYTKSEAYTAEEFDRKIRSPYPYDIRDLPTERFGHPHTGSGHQYFANQNGKFCLKCRVKLN